MQPMCLATANDSRHADIVRRTELAIAELQMKGERVSFYAVADKAQVSRSTLYRCDDLRKLVEEARAGVVLHQVEPKRQDPRIAELERELAKVSRQRDELMWAARHIHKVHYAFVQASSVA